MSRTQRTKRHRFKLGDSLKHKQHHSGKVRDGTPTHPSASCQHHGGCPYCENNRTFSDKVKVVSAEEEIREEME